MHYLRFCFRQDLSQSLPGHNQCMEFCPFEDFPDNQPKNGLDVMLVCKRWLADQSYCHMIALFPASQISAIANHLNPGPMGIAEKRPISEKVRKNLTSMAPRCKASGDISGDAEAFLLQWCAGQLPRLPPPASHALLSYQCPGLSFAGVTTSPWAPPTRQRHINLKVSGESEIQDDEDESEPDDLAPISY